MRKTTVYLPDALKRRVERTARETHVSEAEVIRAAVGLDPGLADASIVILADRLGTDRVLTLDERHFRALPAPGGRPFVLLPADAG